MPCAMLSSAEVVLLFFVATALLAANKGDPCEEEMEELASRTEATEAN